MKKLIIFPGNFLPNIGGLETHVDEFSKFISKKDVEVTIFTPNLYNSKNKEIIYDNVKVIRYPALFIVPNFPIGKFWSPTFWKLYSELYSKKYDIVMTRTRFFTNSTLGFLFAKLRLKRIKLVHVEHGSDFVKVESKITNFISYIYDQILGRLIFRFSDQVVGVSEAAKKFVKKNFTTKKPIKVIRRGIDTDFIDSIKEEKFKTKYKDKTVILFIGRLYKWKGVSHIIQAYQNLPKKLRESSTLLIGGYGEDLERLKNQASKDKTNIHFLGKVPFGKNYALMKACDIYVHSSFPGGGLSSTLMQFMYCKSAIIASPHEGAREIVNTKSGILLKNNSVEEIQKELEKVLKSKRELVKLKKISHDYIKKELSWEKSVSDYLNLFKRL